MSKKGGIYTAGKNFTLPPAVTAVTNSTSGTWFPFCFHIVVTVLPVEMAAWPRMKSTCEEVLHWKIWQAYLHHLKGGVSMGGGTKEQVDLHLLEV